MKFVLTGSEMQDIDKLAIDSYQVPSIILMENAASQAFNFICKNYPTDKSFLILAGGGNNGGDGLALARHLFLNNYQVKILGLFNPKKLEGDVKTNLDMVENFNIPIYYPKNMEDVENLIGDYQIIIDSIFGTGLSRDIDGFIYDLISHINKLDREVISIDIPSGIDSAKGHIRNISIRAKLTLTFEYLKRGHLLYPGREFSGQVICLPISLPKDAPINKNIKCFTMDRLDASKLIKKRNPNSNKGDYGKIALIAGAQSMTGAAYLASQAAKRTGAGLVNLLVPSGILEIMSNKLVEVMPQGLGKKTDNFFIEEHIDSCLNHLDKKQVCAIGPGIGQNPQTSKFLFNLLKKLDLALVLDADALNIVAQDLNYLLSYKAPLVLTPHPGEMSRLLKLPLDIILLDPIKYALTLSSKTQSIVVLKGSTTVVTNPQGHIYLNTSGNAGMASGGSGDVLTGIITSLIGQDYDPYIASILGVFIHGLAGDIASKKYGEYGLIARDIIDSIPEALAKF